ncbi:MAG: thermonuclease family protein [Pseudomonadota bacterium]
MECATDCCIDCVGTTEIFRIWIEVTVEITVRIINFGLRLGPVGIVILIGGIVGYRYTYYEYGRAIAKSGHTIKIGKTRYRLYGIAALKPGQKLTWESGLSISGFVYCRDALTAKIGFKKVRCEVFRKIDDSYDRTVARCSIRPRFGRGREDLGRWLVRNGYADPDVNYIEENPIDKGKYRKILESEAAFARKNKLGIHAGTFVSQAHARTTFRAKWKLLGRPGKPAFGSLDELEAAFGFERRGEELFDVTGKLFGGENVTELAHAAIEAV